MVGSIPSRPRMSTRLGPAWGLQEGLDTSAARRRKRVILARGRCPAIILMLSEFESAEGVRGQFRGALGRAV